MSVDTIATIISAAGLMVTTVASLLGVAAWLVRRIDVQGRELREPIDAQGERLDNRLTAVEREIVDLKIAVARNEGPRPHILPAR